MASRRELEAAVHVLAQAESLLVQNRAESALELLVKLERATPGAKGLAELLAVAQVLAAVGQTPECPRCRRPIGPLPKDYVDWFGVLQVDAKTDEGGIKKRYRQLALLLHPDKNKSQRAQEAFRYLKEAHTALTDSNKRAIFDAMRSRMPACPCTMPAGGRGVQRGMAGLRASQGYSSYLSPTGNFRGVPNRSSSYSSFARNSGQQQQQHQQQQQQFQQQQQNQQRQQQYQQHGGYGSASNLHHQAASGAGWAASEASRLQGLREQARARVVSLEREWEEKKEQWLRDFEQAKTQQQTQQEEEEEVEADEEEEKRQEGEDGREEQAEVVAEGRKAKGDDRTTAEQGDEGRQETDVTSDDEASAAEQAMPDIHSAHEERIAEDEQVASKERPSEENSHGVVEEEAEVVNDSIWEQLADLVDGADVDGADVDGADVSANVKEAAGGKEGSGRKEGNAKVEERGGEAVEVTLSSPLVPCGAKGGVKGAERPSRSRAKGLQRESGGVISGSSSSVDAESIGSAASDSAASVSDSLPSFRTSTSGRAAADAMAAAAAATEAARKVLERSRSVLAKASVRPSQGLTQETTPGATQGAQVAHQPAQDAIPGQQPAQGFTRGAASVSTELESRSGVVQGAIGGGKGSETSHAEAPGAAEGGSDSPETPAAPEAADAAPEAPGRAAPAATAAGERKVHIGRSDNLENSEHVSGASRGSEGEGVVDRDAEQSVSAGGSEEGRQKDATGGRELEMQFLRGVPVAESVSRTVGRTGVANSSSAGSNVAGGDVLDTLQRLRRDTQIIAASLDSLRLRLTAKPGSMFYAAGNVPVGGVAGSQVQVPAS